MVATTAAAFWALASCLLGGAPLRGTAAAGSAAHTVSYLSARRFPLEAVGTAPTIDVCTTPPLPAPSGVKLYASLGQPGNALTFPGFRVGGQADGGSVLPIKPNGTAGCFVVTPGRMLGAGPALLEIVSNGTSSRPRRVAPRSRS